jgi:hypothetical protein
VLPLALSYLLRRVELSYLLVDPLPQLLLVPFVGHHVLLDSSEFTSHLDFVCWFSSQLLSEWSSPSDSSFSLETSRILRLPWFDYHLVLWI